MKKLTILLPLLLSLSLLLGCGSKGGGGGGSSAAVRLINASIDTLDMVSSSSKLATGVAYGSASSYASISGGATPITLEISGSGISSVSSNINLSGTDYSILAYTSYASGQPVLQMTALTDNQTVPAAGSGALLRIYEVSANPDYLDVYMAPVSSPSSSSLLAQNISGSTNFNTVAVGTYHIWVTGAGAPADVRLDMPSVVIGDQQVLTLALTNTVGGVLLDGLLIAQQGAVTAYKNTNARIRVAASLALNGSIASATVNGNSLVSSALSSPAVGSYVLVPAGPLTISVNNANAVIANGLTSVTPGADLTLLTVGSVASPIYYLLNDDNNRPLNSGSYAKIRLVNGVNSSGSLSLSYNSQQVVSNVAFGTASAAANVNTGFDTNLAVGALYAAPSPGVTLQPEGVYSVFMLGDISSPSGILIKDH